MKLSEWVGALSERNFRLFFIGQATSQIGGGMAPIAITFAVLQHGSASDVGYVAAAGTAPLVAFLLVGGVIADRSSRRFLMLVSDALRTVAQTTLGVWILIGHPPLAAFIVLAAVMGSCAAFFYPAMNGLMPQVISRSNLQQANALNGLSGSVSQIVGPVMGGVLAASNPGVAVLVDGLTFGASVLTLYMIDIEWIPKETVETFIHQLRVGWREFWARTWLWVIVAEFSMVNVLGNASTLVLGPVVAKQSLGGAAVWGVILGAEGLGAVIGGVGMLRWHPSRPLFTATVVTFLRAWPILAIAARAPVAVIAGGMLAGGISSAIFGTLWATTMQSEIPSEMLSRLSAYDWFGSLVFLPIGLAIVGPVAVAIGITDTLVGSAVAMVALIAATLLVPSVRRLRAPEPDTAEVS